MAAVEFALLVPILVALLSGIISAGLGYNNVLGVAEGVREGARFGATLPSPGWSGSAVQQHTIDATFLNVSGHPVVVNSTMVCVQLVRAPSTVVTSYPSPCPLDSSRVTPQGLAPAVPQPANPAGVIAGTCLVKVWAQIPVTFKFILIPVQTVWVVRQSVSIYERGVC